MTQENKDRSEFRDTQGFSQDNYGEWDEGQHFRIPTRHPPVAKQLERVWDINHEEPHDNLVKNTGDGGTSIRVTGTPEIDIENYEKEYYKLFMKESEDPLKLAQYLKTKVDPTTLAKTASTWKALGEERGLLGDFYVTVAPFETCKEANTFFKAHNKQALFVQKEAKCNGCVYNKGTTCGLTSKYLTDKVPYTAGIAKKYLNKLVQEGTLPSKIANRLISTNSPKEAIKAANLYKSSQKFKETQADTYSKYTEAKAITATNAKDQDRVVVGSIVEKLIKKGVDYDSIITKVGKHVGSGFVKDLVPKAIRNVAPLNTVKFANCADFLKGHVSLITKDASCSGCVFYADSFCEKFKASFIKEGQESAILNLGKKIKEAEFKNEGYMVNFFKKCIDSGISLVQIKESFKNRIASKQFNAYISGAVKSASKLDPYAFSKCAGNYYTDVDTVFRGANCTGCYFNQSTHCAKVSTKFSNPVKHEGNLYASDAPQDLIRPHEMMKDRPMSPEGKIASAGISGELSQRDVIKKLASQGVTTEEIKIILKEALSKTPLNAVKWNQCVKSATTEMAASLQKTDTCSGCVDNRGFKCSRLGKSFDNYEEKQAELVNTDTDAEWFADPDGSPHLKIPNMEIKFD
jgi:hypothetical protein